MWPRDGNKREYHEGAHSLAHGFSANYLPSRRMASILARRKWLAGAPQLPPGHSTTKTSTSQWGPSVEFCVRHCRQPSRLPFFSKFTPNWPPVPQKWLKNKKNSRPLRTARLLGHCRNRMDLTSGEGHPWLTGYSFTIEPDPILPIGQGHERYVKAIEWCIGRIHPL